MAKKGGKQPGAGRPKGAVSRVTLEKQKVEAAFNQRVMAKADALFNAQLVLALGSQKVFRIDETGEGKNKKREHVLVTDPHEIKALLDEHDGLNGVVDGVYYYFSEVTPDNRAIDSMLNRAIGKPKESVEHSNPDGSPLLSPVADAIAKIYGPSNPRT